ncbi:hypothetical protein MKS88_001105 [Plasmodium brasilianum]|uniref:Uncharacterized protein n=2 Tax=Plasmodium (Plasmodium) TaxID=418103 RepID=A0A1D3JJ72_PLAMA|nr:conserved Plasmodium protein, unknown function [Plasmodium malariae]KAI4840384.1 hypothetical protein MKS88_001105 [Plasmodium brasilianum]SBT86473.1 conserved Plasmodium protein, unknown function [Plasmodium malariae]
MDKNEIRRRERLLRKNKERMKILLGKATHSDDEKEKGIIEKKQKDESLNDNNKNIIKMDNLNEVVNKQDGEEKCKKKLIDRSECSYGIHDDGAKSEGRIENRSKNGSLKEEKDEKLNEYIMITEKYVNNNDNINTTTEGEIRKRTPRIFHKRDDKNSSPYNDDKENNIHDDENNIHDDENNIHDDENNIHDDENNIHDDENNIHDDENNIHEDENKNDEKESNIQLVRYNYMGSTPRDTIGNVNVDWLKFAHFIVLLICSLLLSIFKLKYYDYKISFYNNKPMRMKNKFSHFMTSKIFFIYFSLLYNIMFSLIDAYSYFKKNNVNEKDIIEYIKNIKKKIKNESEALLFILNNGSTVAFFFVNIVKSYVLFIFLTHLFDDLLHNFLIRFYSSNLYKPVV